MYIFLITLVIVLCFIFLVIFLIRHYLEQVIDNDCMEMESEEDIKEES